MEVSTSAKVPHAEFFPPPPSPRGPSLWLARLDDDRRQLVRFWPVIQNMVVGELRVRYQRSILGFVWSLLNPLLMMVILSWVFSGLNTDIENYPLFLVRRHGSLELSERLPERLCGLHHSERGADPEDLRAEAGVSAGASLDRPGDVCALVGGAVFAALAAGGPAVSVDVALAGGDCAPGACLRSASA